MTYLSVCSGIEAATVAWHPLGWRPLAFSEIEPFPSAVLAHHWPDVPNLGDMTKHHDWPAIEPDLVVGGTPCQAFSVAGLRRGLDDPRGNLTLVFLGILARYRPRWVVWENVPGVLSDRTGAFGAFLGGLGELGYGFAYRVLDAQYFGVAQRRRRVFVVGHIGDWRRAAAVLFEPESLRGDHPPSREKGERVAGSLTAGAGMCGASDNGDPFKNGALIPSTGGVSHCLNAGGMGRQDYETETLVAFSCKDHGADAGELSPTLRSMGHDGSHANGGGQVAVAFDLAQITSKANRTKVRPGLPASTLNAAGQMHVAVTTAVRRLTPRECERLQGFPDDHTLIPYRGKPADSCPDGPRYKALGNSMAVPVMRWIGRRINSLSSPDPVSAGVGAETATFRGSSQVRHT